MLPIWVADSETDPFEPGLIVEPFIWGVYNGSEYHEFAETKDFVEFVREKEIILYAHNGGKFDWHFISEWFEPMEPILVIAGRLSRFKIGKCEFRDSINIYNKPLSAYQKDVFDYNKMDRRHRHKYMPEIRKYLKSDCVYLYQLVTGFIDLYGLHITQASAAMDWWKKTTDEPVPRSDMYFYNDFSRFYFGGRVQCFEQGDIEVEALSIDINSAYPEAMKHKHPYGLHYVEGAGKPRKGKKHWGPMFFDIECIGKGAFCYRGTNGTLYYPDDDTIRIYHVTGWELLAALETKTVSDLKFLMHYEFIDLKDFSPYINYFWDERLKSKAEGDNHASDFHKVMMNALYGKFASNPDKYKNHVLVNKEEFYSEGIKHLEDGETWRDFREWVVVSLNQKDRTKGYYNLATAASITGFVRAKLWRAICSSERPMYCDTDSITAIGFDKSVTLGAQIGEWEIEYHYDRVIICGKKLYAFRSPDGHWKVASKGARLNHKDLIRIGAGKTVLYKSEAPTFSVSKSEPTFINREIKATAGDSRIVPRKYDPLYSEEKDHV